MPYAINHVHLRARDPVATAAWYEKHFDAKIVSNREVMPGTVTIGMEMDGPVRLNVSSQPEGASEQPGSAKLTHLGLEHFGFDVSDLAAELARLESVGIRTVLPATEVVGGTKLAYIEGPDDVLIELVQRP
jgi:catechol 2,3-dioxygenase-like lactoylglutathione lyase family enzyme